MKKLLLILLCLPMIGFGQIWEAELLKNNKDATFLEKKIAFENYRTKYPDKKGYNPYARLFDFLEPRIDKDSKYPLDKLYREWRKEKGKYTNSKLSSFSNWQELGPFYTPYTLNWNYPVGNGRINTIEFDPVDPNIIWIGAASGGLWKTIDGGNNWTTNTDNLPVISISAITINPLNTEEMLIATGDAIHGAHTSSVGILRSLDGGISWDTTNLNETVYKLAMNPNYPDSIFAGTDNEIMLSVDGGSNWNVAYSIPSGWGQWVDIEFMPGNTNVIYAALKQYSDDATPYRSIDGGISWAIIDSGLLPDRYNVEIAVTNANPNVIYAVFTNYDDYHGLYKSNNMGDTWVLQSDTPNITSGQGWYNLSLAIDPNNESNVWVGGIYQNTSIDNGQSFNSAWGVHADQHYADFNPLNNTLYVTNDGGIYKYVNNTFLNISDDLRITQFYKLGLSSTNPDKLVGGTQDNGTHMLNNGIFDNIAGADGMECAIDQFNENKIFSSWQYGGLRRCDDISSPNYAWNYITPVNYDGAWVTPYKLHPMDNNMIVAGYNEVYRSFDSGDNWDSISNFGTGQLVTEIALAPSDINYIYLSNSYDSITLTKNGGISWEKKNISSLSGYFSVTDILVSPYDPETIWITASGWNSNEKVFKSSNAGDSWVDISGNNLPNVPVNCIVYQDNAKDDLYVGTDLGVYHRDSTMSEWMPYMTGLPNVAITELEIHYGVNKIRAATYGRGIWESDLNAISLSANFEDILSCTIYPNPTRDKINIAFSKFYQGELAIDIYNLTGEIVFSEILNNNTRSLDISSFKSGCYFISITGENKETSMRHKIIKY
jgi:photosystem II stability/assembly factor-like uncharacterized protein